MNKVLKFQIGIVTLISLLTLSCQKNRSHNRFSDSVETVMLQGNNLYTSSDFAVRWFVPSLGIIDNSEIHMRSISNENLIDVYQLTEDSLVFIHSFLRRGQGPHEVNIFGAFHDRKNETLTFFENSGSLTKGYQIDLTVEGGVQNREAWTHIDFTHLREYTFRNSFAFVSDSLLLAIGGRFNSPNILSLIHLYGAGVVTPLDFWPNDGFGGSYFIKQAVYMDNARIFKNFKQDKYLYVSALGKLMVIFQIENNKMINKNTVVEILPQYGVMPDGLNFSIAANERNRGFRVFTTDRYIYAVPLEFSNEELRSRRSRSDGFDLEFNDNMYVFNWEGTLLGQFVMDTPFVSFVVSEDDGTIFTHTMDLETGDCIVRKYSLHSTPTQIFSYGSVN